MALSIGPLNIGNTLGLAWLGLLIPLILFYLIRPRPKTKEIPSLMFFLKSSGRAKLLSFFRMFVYDFMLIVQFLLLFALLSTPSQPFTFINHDITSANTVIVIDASASMQTLENGKTRFRQAISEAKKHSEGKISIVVAQDPPWIGLEEGNTIQASSFLNNLNPSETGSRIGDSILLAGELLRNKEGRVIVVSDFITTEGTDPNIAKAVLQSRGLIVNFINVAKAGKDNVGIIDLVVDDKATTAYIKNFNDGEKNIEIEIAGNKKQVTIPAKGVEPFVFQTLPGINEIKITPEDDFPVDNKVYISAPEEQKVKVLLITNAKSSFLENALKASPIIELTISEPPIVSKERFDVAIIHNIDREEILPGTFEDLLKGVKGKSAAVIVAAQDDTLEINYKGLVPFGITGKGENGFITISNPARFTKNLEFGRLPTYYTTSIQPGVIPVAIVEDGSAVITVANVEGGGKLIYYGILEKGSDFKFSPYYPIFWHEIIKFASDKQDISTMNDRTGNSLILGKTVAVSTPEGKQETNRLSFGRAGIYRLPEKSIAVNLLDEKESDVNPKQDIGESAEGIVLEPVKEKRQLPLEYALIIAALVLLLVETLYVKLRGDV